MQIILSVLREYLEPDPADWVNGRSEDVHLTEESVRLSGVVLGGTLGDQVGRPGLTPGLVVLGGV